jgi:hypothetical protein
MPISKKRQPKNKQTEKATLLKSLISQGKEFAIIVDARQSAVKVPGIDRSNSSFSFSLNPRDRDMMIQVGKDNVLRCEFVLDFPPQSPDLKKAFQGMIESHLPPSVLKTLKAAKDLKPSRKAKPIFSVGASVVLPLQFIYVIDDLTNDDRFFFEDDLPEDLRVVENDHEDGLTPEEDAMWKKAFANAIRQVFSAELGEEETEKLVSGFLSGSLDVSEDELSLDEIQFIEKACKDAIEDTLGKFGK